MRWWPSARQTDSGSDCQVDIGTHADRQYDELRGKDSVRGRHDLGDASPSRHDLHQTFARQHVHAVPDEAVMHDLRDLRIEPRRKLRRLLDHADRNPSRAQSFGDLETHIAAADDDSILRLQPRERQAEAVHPGHGSQCHDAVGVDSRDVGNDRTCACGHDQSIIRHDIDAVMLQILYLDAVSGGIDSRDPVTDSNVDSVPREILRAPDDQRLAIRDQPAQNVGLAATAVGHLGLILEDSDRERRIDTPCSRGRFGPGGDPADNHQVHPEAPEPDCGNLGVSCSCSNHSPSPAKKAGSPPVCRNTSDRYGASPQRRCANKPAMALPV